MKLNSERVDWVRVRVPKEMTGIMQQQISEVEVTGSRSVEENKGGRELVNVS
jgi:hypothetical protein